ncbi:hypothetical protein CFHF_07115 [Caulobacter flavus]|uniref:Uncharacterized protein n=1 Tax=Caulobacter flavus TaxID=1679497 RepID=A0A2N5CWF0_9CAUL|nr:hypothetical protein C1707_00770 [Caulobacter flavus]PLR18086.1 hypothetical protein CFHF_07115 [Caulobacter flavus]
MNIVAAPTVEEVTAMSAAAIVPDRQEVAMAALLGAWRTLRAAGLEEAEVQALFHQIADRPEDVARRLRKMVNGLG